MTLDGLLMRPMIIRRCILGKRNALYLCRSGADRNMTRRCVTLAQYRSESWKSFRFDGIAWNRQVVGRRLWYGTPPVQSLPGCPGILRRLSGRVHSAPQCQTKRAVSNCFISILYCQRSKLLLWSSDSAQLRAGSKV